ncbi:hypothetical protein SAMN04489729_8442 [Amycolatopsis lurida]|uniref:Uncharacterized protein n=1 Tax=Amycolatopsis lurida NRRL 2430 TaxID=1460371 RepID=A0A2P2FG47_AMYLU|nr:hypothetical protein [Amycolatopsis lurida]KFU75684.1 hypothetical protein BB31_40095 [Amycolatopsis lurida NRRL 2430]SEE63141.1 hypothetical protein SAMN04489729_8442 [Amycolatopsis lurida]
MTKERIDEIIGAAPLSTVDVEAIVARERKTAWLRPNPWVATAAGVAAVAVGAAFVLAPGTPGAVSPAAATSSAPELPEPCKIPTLMGPVPTEKPVDAATRLTGVLTTAVTTRLATGTTLTPNAANYPTGDPGRGPLQVVHSARPVTNDGGTCSGGEDEFVAGAATVRSGKKGSVQATLGRMGGRLNMPADCVDQTPVGMEQVCHRSFGPKGEVIVATTLTGKGGGPSIHRVEVARADRIGVILEASNAVDAKHDRKPDSPVPPLTLEQLAEIALDPGMTLYP